MVLVDMSMSCDPCVAIYVQGYANCEQLYGFLFVLITLDVYEVRLEWM